jgi:ferredoxin-NADP reductase
LLYSARTLADVVYREELTAADGVHVRLALTREQPEGWDGYDRRIDAAILAETVWAPEDRPLTYVCGPSGFVETVANCLVDLGHDPASVRTERFGPTG